LRNVVLDARVNNKTFQYNFEGNSFNVNAVKRIDCSRWRNCGHNCKTIRSYSVLSAIRPAHTSGLTVCKKNFL